MWLGNEWLVGQLKKLNEIKTIGEMSYVDMAILVSFGHLKKTVSNDEIKATSNKITAEKYVGDQGVYYNFEEIDPFKGCFEYSFDNYVCAQSIESYLKKSHFSPKQADEFDVSDVEWYFEMLIHKNILELDYYTDSTNSKGPKPYLISDGNIIEHLVVYHEVMKTHTIEENFFFDFTQHNLEFILSR